MYCINNTIYILPYIISDFQKQFEKKLYNTDHFISHIYTPNVLSSEKYKDLDPHILQQNSAKIYF